MQVEELLENVQHLRHLRENDYFGSFVVERLQKLGQLLQFAAVVLN
jgi:hypothetical protein